MTSETAVIATYHDGDIPKLYSDVWAKCQPVHIKHYWTGELAPSSRHAEVRICWNNDGLTVRFVCAQHEPLVIATDPVTDKKTLGLWDRDVCEIFIAPKTDNPNNYFEFEAAPTGEWIDLAIRIAPTGRETEWDFASGMTTTAKIEGEQIIVTISIPWSLRIPKPGVGQEWLVNLFRCVGPDEWTRYLTWRPTKTAEPNFHVPEAFGVLRFK